MPRSKPTPRRPTATRSTRPAAGERRAAPRTASARRTRGADSGLDSLTLRWPEVQFIQAHRTHAHGGRAPIATGFARVVGELYDLGVRGFELEVRPAPDGRRWSVGGDDRYRPEPERQLAGFLREIEAWSWARRTSGGHEPIVLHLALRGAEADADFPDAFDECVGVALHRMALVSPRTLLRDADERLARVAGELDRWPTLAQLRQSVLVCLGGQHEQLLADYAARRPGLRLCFADYSPSHAPWDAAQFRGPDRMIVDVSCRPGGWSGDRSGLVASLAPRTDLLARVWWETTPQRPDEHVADALDALEHGAWCVASSRPGDVLRAAGMAGYRRRPGGHAA